MPNSEDEIDFQPEFRQPEILKRSKNHLTNGPNQDEGVTENPLFYQLNKGKFFILNCNLFGMPDVQDDIRLLTSTFESLHLDVDLNEPISKFFKKSLERPKDDNSCIDFLVVFIFESGHPSETAEREELFHIFASMNDKPKLLFELGPRNNENSHSDKDCFFSIMRNKFYQKSTLKLSNFLYFYCNKVSETLEVLCSELKQNSSFYDLNIMLSNILQQVKQNSNNGETICYIKSTLTKLVAFEEIKQMKSVLANTAQCFHAGICYIVYDGMSTRNKAEHSEIKCDVEKLKNVFNKINFHVELEDGCKSNQDCVKFMDKLSQEDYSTYDCFVLCYLSHECYNTFGGPFERYALIDLDDLIRSLASNKTLNSKPKICLLQTPYDDCDFETDMIETSAWNYSDIFVFLSNIGLSNQTSETGSSFVKNFCEIFEKYHDDYDLNTIATMVCKSIVETERLKKFVPMPIVHTTMTKPIKFTELKKL